MNKVVVTNQTAITVHGVPPGGSVAIEVDGAGVPRDAFWRRRLRDAEVDGSFRVEPEPVTDAAPGKAVDDDAALPAAPEPAAAPSAATKKERTK